MAAFVQSTIMQDSGQPWSVYAYLDAPPTPGNTIFLLQMSQGYATRFLWPDGFDELGTVIFPSATYPETNPSNIEYWAIARRVVQEGDTGPWTFTDGGSRTVVCTLEFSGCGASTLDGSGEMRAWGTPVDFPHPAGMDENASRILFYWGGSGDGTEADQSVLINAPEGIVTAEYIKTTDRSATAGYRIVLNTGTNNYAVRTKTGNDNARGAVFAVTVPTYPGVFADWDGDGFGVDDDDNVTSHVASWVITRGASAEITGGAEPGGATITLNNPSDDRYNPMNTAGPLYGKLVDGVPFWIGVGQDGFVSAYSASRGLFGGRIKDITPLPMLGSDVAPQVEITLEDALSWLDRVPVQLEDGIGRSQGEIRAAILAAAGETEIELPSEIATIPLSGWNGSALAALEELNAGNGSRHFIRPADDKTDWYTYVCRNRQWRLDATVDGTVDDASGELDATRGITGTSGWRLSADTVINQQRATVTPTSWTPGQVTVWEADALPIYVAARTHYIRIEFDDFVDSPVVDYNYTGTAPTVTLYPYGTTALLTIYSAGATNIRALSIEGRMARRAADESVVIDDTTSQTGTRGIRAGTDISGQFVGTLASARGIAAHVVWRYATPQLRPTMTVEDWMPYQFELELYDVIEVTVGQLAGVARLFEIVGITHESMDIPVHRTTYVLQECRVQTDPGWFILDASLLDGADILAY